MEKYLEGRYTTLRKLQQVRDNYDKPRFARAQAARSMSKILVQLRDRKLMLLRRQLMEATQANDQHSMWLYESRIKAHEKRYNEIMECTCPLCYQEGL